MNMMDDGTGREKGQRFTKYIRELVDDGSDYRRGRLVEGVLWGRRSVVLGWDLR